MPRAILSVSDKTGLSNFAAGLKARGFELVSTGGTSKSLTDAGLPVTNVSDVTGFPEMMDGRVKTLHPMIHGGILARRQNHEDMEAAAQHAITMVDVVCVNLYPFGKAAADPATTFDDLIEQIDIGGPSLVRAAAKNFRNVIVVVDPADYPEVLAAIESGEVTLDLRLSLMQKAFAHTANYDALIAGEMNSSVAFEAVAFEDGRLVRIPSEGVPNHLSALVMLSRVLRYGENPHQRAGWYSRIGVEPPFDLIQGKELSFTNMLDLEAARRIVGLFEEPAAVVVKHTNPCGIATASFLHNAYTIARDADPTSAFGGIVGVNGEVTVRLAERIVDTFIECVIAPSVNRYAAEILARKSNMRVVIDRAPRVTHEIREALGGWLVQEVDTVPEAQGAPWGPDNPSSPKVVTRRQPTSEEWIAMQFACKAMAFVKSNAVVYTAEDRTKGVGGGQPNRKASAQIGGGVLDSPDAKFTGVTAVASDAFFPFRDGLDVTVQHGATAVVQPGGSRNDEEVIAAADEHDLTMVFTGHRHFRH